MLIYAAEKGLERSKNMKIDASVFDMDEYMTKLTHALKTPDGFDWECLSQQVLKCSKRAPAVEYL
jgi:hypothetical protein